MGGGVVVLAPVVAARAGAFKGSGMTPLRKKILALGRKYDGQIMTVEQAQSLQGTLGSMDDTLTDDEVWMFLKLFAEGREPDIVIRADEPDNRLVKVRVDEKGQVSIAAPGFSQS